MNLSKAQWGLVALVVAAVAIITLAFCSSADAREFYVKAEVGQTLEIDADGFGELPDGDLIGAYLGTDVGPLRVEGGVSNLSTEIAGIVRADANYYSGTAYLDLANGLYIGAGVGYAQGEVGFGPFSVDDEGYGYHFAGGYAHRVSDRVIAEFQVRRTTVDFDSFGDVDTTSATVGLRMAL